MMDEKSSNDNDGMKVGFLSMREADGAFRCGILVTDNAGLPLELRATDPIRPTLVQRVAYGGSLERAIAKICGAPLLNALEEQPTIIVTDMPSFLSLHTTDRPIACITPHGETFDLDNGHDDNTSNVLEPPPGRVHFIGIDFDRTMPTDQESELRHSVARLYSELDIFEPFGRVHEALKVLDRQDSGG
jgi:hypothetical protein